MNANDSWGTLPEKTLPSRRALLYTENFLL